MAVNGNEVDKAAKPKKTKKSSEKKIGAPDEQAKKSADVSIVKADKSKKRKRDDAETIPEEVTTKVKKPKKDKKKRESQHDAQQQHTPTVNGGSSAPDATLQDLAFVDTQGSEVTAVPASKGPKESKEQNPQVKKAKLLPKKDRKELKRLKKSGLMKEHAAYLAKASEPEVREDTRKVRKERRRLQKKGLMDELAVFEQKVLEDKEAKARATEQNAAEDESRGSRPVAANESLPTHKTPGEDEDSKAVPVPQKKSKKTKKSSKSEEKHQSLPKATSDAHAGTANGAEDDSEAAPNPKREPLADPVVPQKEHRFIVFVGNLPFSATKEQVQKHFKAVHPVDVRLMTDKETGKFKGFGFVEFDRYDYMNSCLQKYHHTHFAPGTAESRRINVELTVGGGGAKEERKNKIKDKNMKLRHEQYRRREKVKDEEYKQKLEETDKSKPKDASAAATAPAASVKKHAPRDGIHPSRLGQVRN